MKRIFLFCLILISASESLIGQSQGVSMRATNGIGYGTTVINSLRGKINTGNVTNASGSRVAYVSDIVNGSNAYITNIYASNIFVTNLFATNAYITNIVNDIFRGRVTIVSNLYATNIITTNIFAANTYTTNLYTTNLFSGNTYISNAYVTNLYVTNLVGGNLSGDGSGISNAVVLIPGSNVTITTNSPGRVWTIASSGGGGGTTYTNNTDIAAKITGSGIGSNLTAYARLDATTNNFTGDMGVNGQLGVNTATASTLNVTTNVHGVITNFYAYWNNNGFLVGTNDGSGLTGVPQVWTNSNGTIRPVTGSTISNLVFDTSVPFPSGNVFGIKNDGTNKAMVNYRGGLFLGASSLEWAGASDASKVALIVFADPDIGDAPPSIIEIGAGPADASYGAVMKTTVTVNSVDHQLQGYDTGTNSVYMDSLYEVSGGIEQEYQVNGIRVMNFHPTASSGATTYTLNTSLSHTSGNLLELANNTTNKITVDYSGKVTALNLITPTNTPSIGQFIQATSSSGDSKWNYVSNALPSNLATNNGNNQFSSDQTVVGKITANNIVTPTNAAVIGQVMYSTSTSGDSKWDYVNQVSTNSNPVVPDFNLPVNYWQTNSAFLFLSCANVDTTKLKYQVTDVIVTNSTAAAVLATFNGTVTVTGTPYITNLTKFHFSQYAQLWTNCSCEPIR